MDDHSIPSLNEANSQKYLAKYGKMNIQIFGLKKSFDTQKAERYFKERKIKFQYVDLARYGLSKGELQSIKNAVGLDNLVDYEGEE